MTQPKVWGDQDITIAIGPTGTVRVWAGQTLVGYLTQLELKVKGDRTGFELSFATASAQPDIQLEIESQKAKLAGFPQVTAVYDETFSQEMGAVEKALDAPIVPREDDEEKLTEAIAAVLPPGPLNLISKTEEALPPGSCMEVEEIEIVSAELKADPVIFTTPKEKPLAELTAADIPRRLNPEDVASDCGPEVE
jgi:hypothetical protein